MLIHTYLLAANLFALTALLLGLSNFSGRDRGWRLLPLFLLVVSRALILILAVTAGSGAQADPLLVNLGSALELFSVVCVVWALIDPAAGLSPLWRRLKALAGGAAALFCLAVLVPGWPLPPSLHGLIIAMLGLPLILVSLGRLGWLHLVAPLLLAGAGLLQLLEMSLASWLVRLLAYACLIGALHWESLQTYRTRQQRSEAKAQEALSLSRQRQRWLEVSNIIAAAPGLEQAMPHIARSMAHLTASDQAAIFMLQADAPDQVRLAALYNPEAPTRSAAWPETVTFTLSDVFPLQVVVEEQKQQVYLSKTGSSPSDNHRRPAPAPLPRLQMAGVGQSSGVASLFSPVWTASHAQSQSQSRSRSYSPSSPASSVSVGSSRGLDQLYGLWEEERLGPTLLQPLTLQGQAIGALLLGNPLTQTPISDDVQMLCARVAPQIGALVESYRRYVTLEQKAKTGALVPLEPAEEPESQPESEPEPRAVSGAKSEPSPTLPPEPVSEAASPAPVSENSPAILGAEQAAPLETRLMTTLKRPTPVQTTDTGQKNQTLASDSQATVLEAVHEGIVVSDTQGRVRLVNKAAERILGKSRQTLLGQPIAAIYGAIDSGEAIEELATAFSRRNEPLPTFFESEERAIQGRLIPWRNEEKEWMGIIAVLQDVTQTIKADRAKKDFITALSRELRAPLTTIRGYSELIMRGSLEEYTPAQLHVQQIMHSSVDRMVAVLDNAIQMGAQNQKPLPHFAEIDPQTIIDEVLQAIEPLAEIHELTVSQEIKTVLPPLVADRDQLYRILENLLANACQFTPPGGQIALRGWVQQEKAQNTPQPFLLLAVVDTGVGIPASEHSRVFEPFYQIPGVLEPGGMGMGLAVVKELVELHQGRVWVESVPGEGSVFQVALPLTQE